MYFQTLANGWMYFASAWERRPVNRYRVILKIGRTVFWMAVNRKSRMAVMRGGESQKVVSGHRSNRNWKLAAPRIIASELFDNAQLLINKRRDVLNSNIQLIKLICGGGKRLVYIASLDLVKSIVYGDECGGHRCKHFRYTQSLTIMRKEKTRMSTCSKIDTKVYHQHGCPRAGSSSQSGQCPP